MATLVDAPAALAAEAAADAAATIAPAAADALEPAVKQAADTAAGFLDAKPGAGIGVIARAPAEGAGSVLGGAGTRVESDVAAAERVKIYDEGPDSDPAVNAVTELIGSIPSDTPIEVRNGKIEELYDMFAEDYPKKAEEYAKGNSMIREALERQRAAAEGSAKPPSPAAADAVADGPKPDDGQEQPAPKFDSTASDEADGGEPPPVDQATQDSRIQKLKQKEAEGKLTPAERAELDRINESKTKAEAPKTEAEKLAEAEQRITNLESRLKEMSKSLENMEVVLREFSQILPEMQKLIVLQIKKEQDPEEKKKQEALLIRIAKAIAAGVLAGFIDMSGDIAPQQQAR